jgi:hypothetical protein
MWTVGQKIRLRWTTKRKNLDGTETLADPTTTTIVVKPPVGSKTTKAWPADAGVVIRESTGSFYYEYTIAEADLHYASAKATGALIGASDPFSFDVEADPTV